MSVIKPNTYPNSSALTITLASLASTSADPPVGRQSTEIVNSTDLANDVLLDGKLTTGTTPTVGQILIYAWGAGYDGTNVRRPAGAGASDAGLTPSSFWRDVFFPVIFLNTTTTSNQEYNFAGVSLLKVFGGLYLPARWGLFVFHNTVSAFNGTSGNFEIRYTPMNSQVV